MYYKATQTRQYISTYQKCGFTHQRVYRIHFGEGTKKEGSFLIEKGKIEKSTIASEGYGWVVYFIDGIYHAIWEDGCSPTNKYGDFTYFINL